MNRRALILGAVCAAACRLRAEGAAAGERAAAFTLPDQDGTVVSLDALTRDGPAVLVFYRGHW